MQTGSWEKTGAPYEAVLIASSAGGVQGLSILLRGLDPALPVPVLIAQHLNRARETSIVAILSRVTPLGVKLAEDGERPRPATIHIAPPDRHLCVRGDGTLALTREERVNFARPAADPLFESAAEALGPLVGCVLTGSDSDGARGVEAVKARGGTVLVQDPQTADFLGMPKSAIGTGKVDHVLTLEEMGPAINRLTHRPARRHR